MRKKKAILKTKTPSYPMIGKPSIDRREFIVLFGVGTASMIVLSACGSPAPVREPTIDPPLPREPKVDINADGGIDADTNEDGFPDMSRVVIKTPGVVIRPQSILFRNKKIKVLHASLAVIDMVAKTLADNPQVESLLIVGHADSREGNPSNRKRLSARRAQMVMDQLVKKGVDRKRLRSIGLSDACPLSIGNTPQFREKNRRVEFKILSLDGAPAQVEIGCDEAIRRKLIPDGVFNTPAQDLRGLE